MWHNPNKLIWYNAWPQENNKSLFFCNWNIMFLEKQKAVCPKSMAILNVTVQVKPRCFRPCLLVLHGKAGCTLRSACSELRTKSAVQPPTAWTQLSDHLRLMTHLILNSFLALGHSETFHCCQIFSHTPTLLYNPWGDDPQFKKL